MDFKVVIREQREELEDIEDREQLIDREGNKHAIRYLKHPNIIIILFIDRHSMHHMMPSASPGFTQKKWNMKHGAVHPGM